MRSSSLRWFLIFIVAISFLTFEKGILAKREEVVTTPVKELSVKGEPAAVSAAAYVIKDLKSGKWLAQKEPDLVLPIASVTKLFSGLAILENYPLEGVIEVIEQDLQSHGGAGGLKVKQAYTYHTLLFPLLLESSNDAAAAYERVIGTSLLEAMNSWVKDKGGTKTIFTDASGLSSHNVSSASDLALLTGVAYQTAPHLFDITTLPRYVNKYGTLTNNNPVLDSSYRGGKHGYTEDAGRTLVAVFSEDIGGEDRELVFIILKSEDLKSDLSILRQFVQEQVTFE